MCASVDFSFHTQGYVSKGRRLLSDAPFGRFPEALACRRLRIRGEIFLFLPKFRLRKRPFRPISRTTDFGCLVDIPLSRLRKAQNGASLAMYPLVDFH